MRIAVQEGLLPGRDFAEKLANAERYGFDAVELNGAQLDQPEGLAERRAALRSSPVVASSICGGVVNRFVDVEPAERRSAVESARRMLAYAAELGARGVICVPIFRHHNRMPDLRPYRSRFDLCRALCVEVLQELAEEAAAAGVVLLLEPLNRYETDFINRLEQGADVIRQLRRPEGVRLMADFFHMHIEEADIPAALMAAGELVGHVHLADSNRREPGAAFTDFVAGFRALQRIGFQGAMALECGLSGPAEAVLPRTTAYLRRCLAEAGAA